MKKQLHILAFIFVTVISIFLFCCKKAQEKSANVSKTLQTSEVDFQIQEIMVPVPERGKWGVIGKAGQWIIKPQFDFVEEFEDGLAKANLGGRNYFGGETYGGQWGFIDKTGRWAISPQFDEAEKFEDGLARARIGGKENTNGEKEGGKWGFIDKTGTWVINPQFDYVDRFKEDLARANLDGKQENYGYMTKGGRWGFIDKAGTWAIRPQFDSVDIFLEDLAGASIGGKPDKDGWLTGGKWGFINKMGEWVISPQFDSVGKFTNGLAEASIKVKPDRDTSANRGRWGFIDKTGKWLISPEFDDLQSFADGLAGARKAGKWGFINETGEWIINPQFDSVRSFEFGLAVANIGGTAAGHAIAEGGKWGFIDKTGEWVANPQFAFVGWFRDGLARANIDGKPGEFFTVNGGKWGFIDKTGKWAINPQFDSVDDFEDGLAKANVGGKAVFITEMEGGKWGVIDKKGRWVINPLFDDDPFPYSKIELISGAIRIIVKEKYVVYDRAGKKIWSEDDTEYKPTGEKVQDTIGTGFYVSADGHVLTNSHIVNGAKKILISGQNAEIVNEDMQNDLALLRVSAKPASYAIFSKATLANVGEDICTYGFPLTSILSATGSLSVGTVSSLSGVGNNISQMQISVLVQPGNSGGPILNRKGHVIGVLVSKLDEQTVATLTGHIPENVNFAINAVTVKAFLDFNKIPYRKSGLFSFKKSNEKIAAEAQKYTVKIECFR